MTPVELVLSRLENVRRSGPGWRADSPCGKRSRGALSIAESDSGGVLIHDFSGYSVREVVEAIGLSLSDLFPTRAKPQTAAELRENREKLALAGARAAATILALEALVLRDAARSIRNGEPFSDEDLARIDEAAEKIDAARIALSRHVRIANSGEVRQ
jgi:hypothetical protein